MPAFSTQRPVAFTAAQMYALVADIAHYPEFLPLCTGLTITSRSPVSDGEELVARMSVGYKSLAESFTTRVHAQPASKIVDVSYVDGPFKRLENRWRFIDKPDGGSVVDFHIDYEFKSPMLAILVGGMFEQAFRKFAEAFEDRARHVYGAPKAGV